MLLIMETVHKVLVDYALNEAKIQFKNLNDMSIAAYPDLATYTVVQNGYWKRGMEMMDFAKGLGYLEYPHDKRPYGCTI